ncbi:MAG: sporulation integral membrane protein YtvI [Lachnospiraceae bacterium]
MEKKYKKIVINLTIAILILFSFVFFVPKLIVFFMPFIIGGILACLANAPVRFFEETLNIKRKAGTAIVIIFVIGSIVGLVYLISALILEQASNMMKEVPTFLSSIETDMNSISARLSLLFERIPILPKIEGETVQNFEELVSKFMNAVSIPTANALSSFAKSLPATFISVIMCLLSAYLFVAEKEYLSKVFHTHMPESMQRKVNLIKRSLQKSVGGYLKAQLKIEVYIYLLMLLGFLILRIPYGYIIAFGIACLDILPFFGTAIILIPWAIFKVLVGEYIVAIGLLLIWGIGQLTRQIIQPKFVGESMGVAPIPTLFLLFVGYKLGGVVGMIIAVPIGIILVNMNEEGVFETTKNSIKILWQDLEQYRKLTDEDLNQKGK